MSDWGVTAFGGRRTLGGARPEAPRARFRRPARRELRLTLVDGAAGIALPK